MTAPMPQRLYICESAATCDGPANCDHKKPHAQFFLPGHTLKFCHEYPVACFFVFRPVACIPFKASPTRTKRTIKRILK